MRPEKIPCANIRPDLSGDRNPPRELDTLVDSIRLHGVLHPVLLRATVDGYLIVHGERDILLRPANAEVLKSRLPQAEVFMIPNAGHNFFAENPMGIHQRIVEFLKG